MNPRIHLVGRKNVLPINIIYMKAEANYSEVYFVDGGKIILSKTLKQLEEKFSQLDFFRPHKSFLINLKHVKRFRPNEDKTISLTNNFEVELSRRKRNQFLELYKNIK